MEEREFEITSNIFGGYNKKKTKEYLHELETLLKETQKELDEAEARNKKLTEKLAEAENCYRVLWERSKLQEDNLKRQHEMLKEFTKKEKNRTPEGTKDILAKKLNTLIKQKKRVG